jgi:hypothetical protein
LYRLAFQLYGRQHRFPFLDWRERDRQSYCVGGRCFEEHGLVGEEGGSYRTYFTSLETHLLANFCFAGFHFPSSIASVVFLYFFCANAITTVIYCNFLRIFYRLLTGLSDRRRTRRRRVLLTIDDDDSKA